MDGDHSQKAHGELGFEIDFFFFSVSGKATLFNSNIKDESHMNNTKITTYTDFHLVEQPSTMEDVFKLFKGQSI
jgi:hypothetical protein